MGEEESYEWGGWMSVEGRVIYCCWGSSYMIYLGFGRLLGLRALCRVDCTDKAYPFDSLPFKLW